MANRLTGALMKLWPRVVATAIAIILVSCFSHLLFKGWEARFSIGGSRCHSLESRNASHRSREKGKPEVLKKGRKLQRKFLQCWAKRKKVLPASSISPLTAALPQHNLRSSPSRKKVASFCVYSPRGQCRH
ncbi:hypothetical protein QBC39DRAFT_103852 [Podospora conica]|nr:hypothetical protein QBC39DRAFT_103852 [Schizothecium conicum]